MIYKDFMTEDLNRTARKEERKKRKSLNRKVKKREKENNDVGEYGSTSDNVQMNKSISV